MSEYSELAGRLSTLRDKHKCSIAIAIDRTNTTRYELERYLEDKAKGLEPQDSIILESIDRLRFLYGVLQESG